MRSRVSAVAVVLSTLLVLAAANPAAAAANPGFFMGQMLTGHYWEEGSCDSQGGGLPGWDSSQESHELGLLAGKTNRLFRLATTITMTMGNRDFSLCGTLGGPDGDAVDSAVGASCPAGYYGRGQGQIGDFRDMTDTVIQISDFRWAPSHAGVLTARGRYAEVRADGSTVGSGDVLAVISGELGTNLCADPAFTRHRNSAWGSLALVPDAA